MEEQFINLLMSKLDGQMSVELLEIVKQELSLVLKDYTVSKNCTDIVMYNQLPECYKAYMVSMKIEGMSDKSLELYNLRLKDFLTTVNKNITEITTNDIRVYLFMCQSKHNICNRTLDGVRAIINAFLEWCCNEGYVPKNPCRNIKPIKYETIERKPLSAIELEKVRDACETLREKAMIEFLYSTACRVTELERLKISDVDFEKREVLLFGKGDKHRVSYISPKSYYSLKKYLETRNDESPSLFVSERKPYDGLKKAGIESIVRKIGIRAKLGRPLFPHLLRHTSATDCLERGMDITEIQKILGHTNTTTTMVYAKISKENVKNSHKKCII